jgi:hypothetical protein
VISRRVETDLLAVNRLIADLYLDKGESPSPFKSDCFIVIGSNDISFCQEYRDFFGRID